MSNFPEMAQILSPCLRRKGGRRSRPDERRRGIAGIEAGLRNARSVALPFTPNLFSPLLGTRARVARFIAVVDCPRELRSA
jgi:hypothetical protein